MDTTFITIHGENSIQEGFTNVNHANGLDTSDEAHILYSSYSIVEVLGYTADEVIGTSYWDYFREDELPLAKQLRSRSVKLDKAAVLAYCQIRNFQGQWVGCECCFSVCYDVLVVCTSIYRPRTSGESIESGRHAVDRTNRSISGRC